ncbi:MAG: aa3-type cytochrome oxidase subunit IV [Actinomycetota bacterium]
MRTGAKVFLGSAVFALVISTIYWFVTYEPAGTVLLVSMILAPGLMAAFAAAGSRGPGRPPEDRPDADPSAPDALVLGPVTPFSVWPALLGAVSLFLSAGLAYGVWLLLPAGAAFVVALVGLARE